MKKEIPFENQFQVDKMMRQLRREQKTQKKVKQTQQARRRAKGEMLGLWLFALGIYAALLSACSAVKKQEFRSALDSAAISHTKQTLNEQRSDMLKSLFESLRWEEDRQTALIRSDSSIRLSPDGGFLIDRGTVVVHSARRQENATRHEQSRQDTQSRLVQSQHQEEAQVSTDLREVEKKKPPGAMLLLPALLITFAFLMLIRKVRQ